MRGGDTCHQWLAVLPALGLLALAISSGATPSPPAPLPQGGEGSEKLNLYARPPRAEVGEYLNLCPRPPKGEGSSNLNSYPRPPRGQGGDNLNWHFRRAGGELSSNLNSYPRPLGGEGGAQRRVRGLMCPPLARPSFGMQSTAPEALRAADESSVQTVWQMGRFDASSAEFQGGPAPTPAPVYVIGKSHPDKDWYAFQPGSANGAAGSRPHPVRVQFNLQDRPTGVYAMKIALLVEHPRVSALQVNINGHAGRFYQHPKLDYTMGDVYGAFFPEYSTDTITFNFPASFLHQGSNEIEFTAVDEPSPGDQTTSEGAPMGDSGVVYDALELDHLSSGKYEASAVKSRIVPTIFYRMEGGELREIVDVFVRFHEAPQHGSVELLLNGKVFRQPLPTDRAFGEHRAEFAVPTFDSPAEATVSVRLNARTQRFEERIEPGKKWTIFVVPHEHLDVGYTDYQPKVAEVHSRVIDEAMDLSETHPGFQFSLDSSWEAQQFLHSRTQAEREKLYRMVQEGKVHVPSQYASLLTGFPTAETLIRSLYWGYAFNQEHGGRWAYANITDVPSYSWSYASVLADAGLKYFIAASDNYHGPVLLLGHLNEESPFWWEGPDGGKILMWYSRHYHQVLTLFGMPPQVAAGHDALPIFFQMYGHPSYKAHAVLLYGTQPENTDLYPQQAALVGEWNQIYAYPKLEYSDFASAVGEIAKQFGDSIRTYRGDGGPYWEDGIAADAGYAALERANEARALSAEKFSTLSTLVNSKLSTDRRELEELWKDMELMDEHTWGDSRSITAPDSREATEQLEVKDSFAVRAHQLVNNILERSMAAVVDSVNDPPNTLVVFNGLDWKRSGLVEFDLDHGWEIVDKTTEQIVPYETVRTAKLYSHVRFVASDVPAVGYKAYELRATKEKAAVPATVSGEVLENSYYRVTLDPQSGAVRSIYDKDLQRKLVDASSPYRFDQYLYFTGADELPNRLVQYRLVSPVPDLQAHPAAQGKLVSVIRAPFGTVAELESSSVHTPRIETQIILFDHEKKIEFINHVHKDEVFSKEGVYFAFPLAMEHPEFRYEVQNGVVDPAKDMLPGAGLEWFSVQHWAAVQNGSAAAAILPLDASLVTLGGIARGVWPTQFGERKPTIFSYVMNNYWDTNYRAAQGGDFTFRYVFTSSSKLDVAALSRLGWEESTPLEVDQITSQDKALNLPRPLDGKQASFLQVNQPNVLLLTWKQAEDAQGNILRFLDLGGEAAPTEVTIPLLDVQSAWSCNAMEANQQSLPLTSGHGFRFEIKPHQILTVRVKGR
jgi:alpha-mannosidase